MLYSRQHLHEPRFQRLPTATAVRPSTATVPVSGAHRPVRGGALGAVAGRLSVTRLSAVRLGTVAVPERANRRAGHYTYFAHVAHVAVHCRASAHRLQVRSRLTRPGGPNANGFGQRNWAQPFVHGQSHEGSVGHIIPYTIYRGIPGAAYMSNALCLYDNIL